MEGTNTPHIFRLDSIQSKEAFEIFLEAHPETEIIDTLQAQLRDYIRTLHPSRSLTSLEVDIYVQEHMGTHLLRDYGCWVYYPWSRRLVHLLDEEEFTSLRTDRNKNKITAQEQALLGKKRVGLIGLSVGQSVATTLALERGFGELRIADYDVLDLSNLNRIRTGVHNIGIPKTTIVSREIFELDPYLNVTCYDEGITDDNLYEFLTADGGLDLLIDECDSLDIKLKCRAMARDLGIPVIMETSDRGMLDVERFDLEPGLPLLHGLTDDISIEDLAQLPSQSRFELVKQIIDFNSISSRLKESFGAIGKTLLTWPQLGSDVVHGGAIAAIISRKILLGDKVNSGRYYIDLEDTLLKPSTFKKTHT